MVEYLGFLAGTLTSLSQLPQVIKVVKTNNTKSISLWTYILLTTGMSVWLLYGIIIKDYPIIISNVVTISFTLTIIRYKVKFG
jgi:MtN3 and saliva related transmembrane protein